MPSDRALSVSRSARRRERRSRQQERAAAREQQSRALRQQAVVFAVIGVMSSMILVAVFEAEPGAQSTSATELLMRAEAVTLSFGWQNALLLVAMGTAAGALTGMLGMGGGVVKVAGLLVLFQSDILLARAVSLGTMFFATVSGARAHIDERVVLWQVVRPMIVPAVVSAIIGLWLGTVLPRATLTHFFAFFIVFLGFNTLAQSFADPYERILSSPPKHKLLPHQRSSSAMIGALHGLICGLLGISGGVTTVPMQQTLLRTPSRNAVANSLVVSACITGAASLAAVVAGVSRGAFLLSEMLMVSFCIGLGAIFGAQFGARMTGKVHAFVLKGLFGVVCLAAGLIILFR